MLVDRGRFEDRPESAPLIPLQDLHRGTVRAKRGYLLMQLESYAVDGRWLRFGAGNLSAFGLKQQDSDMVLVDTEFTRAKFIIRGPEKARLRRAFAPKFGQ